MKDLKNNFKQKKSFKYLIVALILLFSAAVTITSLYSADAGINAMVKEADVLFMQKRGLVAYEKAAAIYKEALSRDPENIDLMIKRSQALNAIMRVKTNGNALKIDGSGQDTEEHKKIWAQYAPESVKLAETAYKKRPDDQGALCAYASSYMFHSSSFGILKAIFAGAAGQYKENANNMINKFPKVEEAEGYIFLAAFDIFAPWPMNDINEAKKLVKKALEICPYSPKVHHYAAILAIKDKDYETARKELSFVLNNECAPGPEYDYCGFLKEQAKKGLEMIEGK